MFAFGALDPVAEGLGGHAQFACSEGEVAVVLFDQGAELLGVFTHHAGGGFAYPGSSSATVSFAFLEVRARGG